VFENSKDWPQRLKSRLTIEENPAVANEFHLGCNRKTIFIAVILIVTVQTVTNQTGAHQTGTS
jgi:hypothetical protein